MPPRAPSPLTCLNPFQGAPGRPDSLPHVQPAPVSTALLLGEAPAGREAFIAADTNFLERRRHDVTEGSGRLRTAGETGGRCWGEQRSQSPCGVERGRRGLLNKAPPPVRPSSRQWRKARLEREALLGNGGFCCNRTRASPRQKRKPLSFSSVRRCSSCDRLGCSAGTLLGRPCKRKLALPIPFRNPKRSYSSCCCCM